jgi:myosin heavy subunit
MQTKLFLHHQIDLKDLETMNFNNLMKKTLIIAKANRRLKEIRNLNKKKDKLSDLTDRCDNREALSLTEKKEIFNLTISIAQSIRALNRRAEKNHNRRMNEITSVMNAMILVMRVESTQSFISQRYNSNSTKSTIQQENNANVRVNNVTTN